jgi:hypothetical protein
VSQSPRISFEEPVEEELSRWMQVLAEVKSLVEVPQLSYVPVVDLTEV